MSWNVLIEKMKEEEQSRSSEENGERSTVGWKSASWHSAPWNSAPWNSASWHSASLKPVDRKSLE